MDENNIETKKEKRGILGKISFILLFIVTFLTPIFFLPVSFISTQFGTSLLFAFGVIIATLIVIVSALISGELDLPHPMKYLVGLSMLVPVVYLLAGIANGFSRMSFFGYTFDITTAGFILLAFLFLSLVSLLFRDKKRIFYSYVAFVASSLLVSLFLLIRIIFGVKALSFGMFNDLTGTMIGSWNNVAIFFGIGAILSFITYQMLRVSRFMKILLSLAMVLSLFFLALVNFKSVWIIVALSSLLFFLYGVWNGERGAFMSSSLRQKLNRLPLYPVIVFLISVVMIIWSASAGAFLSNKLKVASIDVRPSLSVTLNIARNTLKSQPLFGSGPNSFVMQWLANKPDEIINTVYWNTDFTYGIGLLPTFAVTTGLIGILSWLVFFGFLIYLGMKSLFARIEDSFTKYLVVSSFFISLYLWIMAWIYVPSVVIFVLTFFFTGLFLASVYVSGIVSVSPYKFSYTPKAGFVSSFVLVLLFVAALSLGYGLLRNSQSLWYFQQSSYALNTTGNITNSEAFMKNAIAIVPYDVYYRSLAEIEILKLNAIAAQDQTKVSKEDIQKQYSATLSDAITAGLSARTADQSNYLNWVSLGSVYEAIVPAGVQGAYESAQLAYSEALRRNPKNPIIYLYFARLAMAKQDYTQARAYAQNAISEKQNYPDAYYLLTQIEVADKNLNGAIDSATKASVLSPTDASIFFQIGLLKYNNQDYAGAIAALEKSISLAPDYANAKYFLGLSYEVTKQHDKAIAQFQDLTKTNPDNADVKAILTNLMAGKSIFNTPQQTSVTKGSKPPVKENQ